MSTTVAFEENKKMNCDDITEIVDDIEVRPDDEVRSKLLAEVRKEFTLLDPSFVGEKVYEDKASGKQYKRTFKNPRAVFDNTKNGNWTYQGGLVTGACIYMNASRYACIDVDMKADNKEDYQIDFEDYLKEVDVKIEMTTSGGLHIWCKWDSSLQPKTGRETKIFTDVEGAYDIDLFTPISTNRPNLVLVAPSKALKHDGKSIGEYKWIRKCEDSKLSPLADVVKALEKHNMANFDAVREGGAHASGPVAPKKTKKETKKETQAKPAPKPVETSSYDDGADFVDDEEEKPASGMDVQPSEEENSPCTKELFELLKEGFSTFPKEFHKDRETKIVEEPTIWALFKGAYGCIGEEVSADDVNDWLDDLRDTLQLTKSASSNWSAEKKRYKTEDNKGPGMLVLLLKYHHPEFYNSKLKEYYKTHANKKVSNGFDIYDGFDLLSIEDSNYKLPSKSNDDDDKNDEEEAKVDWKRLDADIRKILRLIRTDGQVRYIYKDMRSSAVGQSRHKVRILDDAAASKILSTVKLEGLPKEKRGGQMKKPTLASYVEGNPKKFRAVQWSFYKPNDPECFSLFSGYAFKELEGDLDVDKIKLHLKHWKEQLCSNHEDQYEYLLNWCAYLLQKVTGRTTTVLTLISKQGTGKNVFFTEVLQNILTTDFSYYTTDMNNILGPFNSAIEFKKLIVADEAKSTDNSRYNFDYDRFKGTVTSSRIDINEKCKPQRQVDNIFNMIITSNNPTPFKIEDNDRRMVFLDVSNQYCAPADDAPRTPEVLAQIKRRKEYFGPLEREQQDPLFLRTMFTFLMRRDISHFDPEGDKPFTTTKGRILAASKPPVQMFLEDNISKALDNWTCEASYANYKNYCQDHGFKVRSIQTYHNELASIGVTTQRKRIDGSKNPVTVLCVSDEAKARMREAIEEAQESVNPLDE